MSVIEPVTPETKAMVLNIVKEYFQKNFPRELTEEDIEKASKKALERWWGPKGYKGRYTEGHYIPFEYYFDDQAYKMYCEFRGEDFVSKWWSASLNEAEKAILRGEHAKVKARPYLECMFRAYTRYRNQGADVKKISIADKLIHDIQKMKFKENHIRLWYFFMCDIEAKDRITQANLESYFGKVHLLMGHDLVRENAAKKPKKTARELFQEWEAKCKPEDLEDGGIKKSKFIELLGDDAKLKEIIEIVEPPAKKSDSRQIAK